MKFNHIFLCVALSAALMGSFTSCDDFLAEDPYAFVGPDQVGNDNVAVNLWVTGVYSKWANDMFRWQNFPRVLEMDCDYTSGPDWAFSNLGAGNFQGDEVADAVWKGCYSLINRANVALNYVNQITGADEKGQSQRHRGTEVQQGFCLLHAHQGIRRYSDVQCGYQRRCFL